MSQNILRNTHTVEENENGRRSSLGGEVPYIDPYTGIPSPAKKPQNTIVKDLSRASDTERYILLLRALVTTHCLPRPMAGANAALLLLLLLLLLHLILT